MGFVGLPRYFPSPCDSYFLVAVDTVRVKLVPKNTTQDQARLGLELEAVVPESSAPTVRLSRLHVYRETIICINAIGLNI